MGIQDVTSPRWSRRVSQRVAFLLGFAALALTLAAIPLVVLSGGQSSGLPVVPFAVVGWVVARRQPRNPIGWILLVLSLVFMLASDAGQYAVMAYHQGYHLPVARAAAFVAGWWVWIAVLLPLPIGLFPDGRVSGRWRYVLWAYGAVCFGLIAVLTWRDATGIGASRIRVDSTGELLSVGNAAGLAVPFWAALIAFCLLWLLRPLISFRGSTGIYRQQLKWLLVGGVICLAGFVMTLAGLSFAFVAILALPIAMGVGILRYRLFDLDWVISRTISYLIVTGLLAAVFFAVVLVATRVLPFSSPIAVAASTLVIAALFNPLRRRVQRFVDRHFNRSRYDAEAIVSVFGSRLRDALDVDAVRKELESAAMRTVQPASVSLWIRPGE